MAEKFHHAGNAVDEIQAPRIVGQGMRGLRRGRVCRDASNRGSGSCLVDLTARLE